MKSKLQKLHDNIKELYNSKNLKPFEEGKSKIKLIEPTFNHIEILEALESLISTNVTMGKKVCKFEQMFAKYCQSNFGTMVNSGSSANLIGVSVLTNPEFKLRLKKGSEVITPAVTWATTIFPLINVGLKPKLVDVELETFCLDSKQIVNSINEKTGLVLPVHLLGNVCNMDEIVEIVKKKNLLLMEDCCEAHGAKFRNRSVGTFGNLGTFSFFLSHHITTIEGGMIVTNNEQIFELSKMLRAFGWIRDILHKNKKIKENPNIDPRFLFANLGYNFRPTEIQGSFGIKQLPKLKKFIKIRESNTQFWNKNLAKYDEFLILPKKQKNTKQVHFCYPLTIRKNAPFSRKDLITFLEKKLIETRPIMAGNMAEQPVMKLIQYSKTGTLPNSKLIMKNSFFIGNHQGIQKPQREYVVSCFSEFFEYKKWKK